MARVQDNIDLIGQGNQLVTVDTPEFGEGVSFSFRTRLTVGDMMSFPPGFSFMPEAARNAILFRLLVREGNGLDPGLDDDKFAKADARALSAIMKRSGVLDKVERDFALDPGGEATPQEGKKPR